MKTFRAFGARMTELSLAFHCTASEKALLPSCKPLESECVFSQPLWYGKRNCEPAIGSNFFTEFDVGAEVTRP